MFKLRTVAYFPPFITLSHNLYFYFCCSLKLYIRTFIIRITFKFNRTNGCIALDELQIAKHMFFIIINIVITVTVKQRFYVFAYVQFYKGCKYYSNMCKCFCLFTLKCYGEYFHLHLTLDYSTSSPNPPISLFET